MIGSFAQANQQRKLADKARNAAAEAVRQARAELETNYMSSVTLPTKAYEAQREAIGQQATDLMMAGVEGDQRGVGAVASQVMAARTKAEQDLTAQIQKDDIERQKLIAEEESRLAGERSSISLQEAGGAALAARDAAMARAKAQENAFGSIGDFGQAAASIFGGEGYKSGASGNSGYSKEDLMKMKTENPELYQKVINENKGNKIHLFGIGKK